MFIRPGFTLLVICLALINTSTVYATTLDESVGEVVVRLTQYLASRNESSITLGQFIGPKELNATSGPQISKMFVDHFAKNKIDVRAGCNVGLQGLYDVATGSQGLVGVKLNCSLVDPAGQIYTDFTIHAEVIDKPEEVVELLGVTTNLYPEDIDEDRNKDLKKRITNPKCHIDGSKCSADQKSPFSVEIAVNGRPLPVNLHEGLGFVDIQHGDVYTVRLYNNSQYEAAVRLSIDGLSVFTFSDILDPRTREPKYQHYIIPPQRHIELYGWHKTNEVVNSFLVTSYAKSAAATIQHKQDIGTITAVFSAAWAKDGTPPSDENLVGRGDNATGFGPPVKQVSEEVERTIGRLRSSISLRYNK